MKSYFNFILVKKVWTKLDLGYFLEIVFSSKVKAFVFNLQKWAIWPQNKEPLLWILDILPLNEPFSPNGSDANCCWTRSTIGSPKLVYRSCKVPYCVFWSAAQRVIHKLRGHWGGWSTIPLCPQHYILSSMVQNVRGQNFQKQSTWFMDSSQCRFLGDFCTTV